MTEDLKWTERLVSLKALKPYEKNPRTITKDAYAKLVSRIQRLGYHNRLKVTHDYLLVDGHQRLKALKKLGYSTVEVLVPSRELTEPEFREILVSSNLHDGVFDMDELANNFDVEDLVAWGMESTLFGELSNAPEVPEPVPDEKEPSYCPNCQFELDK